jgi:hypothetical protein
MPFPDEWSLYKVLFEYLWLSLLRQVIVLRYFMRALIKAMRIMTTIMAAQNHTKLLIILQFSTVSGFSGLAFGFAVDFAVEFEAAEVAFPAFVVELPVDKVELVPRRGAVSFEAASTIFH